MALAPRLRRLAPSEVVRQVIVRPMVSGERVRWDALMRDHHYLGLQALVGKSLRYVAVVGDAWLALLGWPRVLQYQRLHLIANQARLAHLPNLASRVLSLNLKRLASDWQAVHGHPVVLAETFVDRARFSGTCYRAANWKVVGQTRGVWQDPRALSAPGCPQGGAALSPASSRAGLAV